MKIEELNKKIEQWAIDRHLDKEAEVKAQSIKSAEEFSELIIGICKDKKDLIVDSIGDVYVTLVVGNLIHNKLDLVKIYKEVKKDYQGLRGYLWMNGKTTQIMFIGDRTKLILRQGYSEWSVKNSIELLLALSEIYNLSFEACAESAYKVIANRKGRMINGQFVKQEDLPC